MQSHERFSEKSLAKYLFKMLEGANCDSFTAVIKSICIAEATMAKEVLPVVQMMFTVDEAVFDLADGQWVLRHPAYCHLLA